MKDRERLVKRTQLKRSVYRILGTREGGGEGTSNGTSEVGEKEEEEQEKSGRVDPHLHDYDPEIFDDDDFYHQVKYFYINFACGNEVP